MKPTMTRSRKLFAAGAALLAAVAAGVVTLSSRPAQANPELTQSVPATAKAWEKFFYQEASACSQCHSVPNAQNRGSLDLCMFSEWSVWKTHDKHAQAYAVLKGERGRKIGELLKQDVLKQETGCLGCHAMSNLPGKGKGQLDPQDGVSCGGCHGPSGGDGGWLGPHSQKNWRNKTPEEKYALGLRDLRDPVIRAELCMSCHVGNAEEGKVVSHAMMAAGHPPL